MRNANRARLLILPTGLPANLDITAALDEQCRSVAAVRSWQGVYSTRSVPTMVECSAQA